MKRSKLLAGAIALLPAAGLLAITQLADAHYPGIDGTAVCIDTTANVELYVESWQTDEPARRANNNVDVQWDGVSVGKGKFTAENGYKFTLKITVKADGAPHAVKAVAVDPFGPSGEYGFEGTFRTNTVAVPPSCVPTTTAAPTTTAPVTTTTQSQVLGIVVTRPDIPAPVEVLPKFAG